MPQSTSGSFADPADEGAAESDVAGDEAQVEPDAEADSVGRVAGQDEGYAGEQGAEVRAREGSGS